MCQRASRPRLNRRVIRQHTWLSLRVSMLRLFQQLLWMLSDRATLHGYPVAYGVSGAECPELRARLEGALCLLAEVRPRWLQRMRHYVRRIQVREVIDSLGKWHHAARLVELDAAYLCMATTSISDIASTLVHEFTHARIDAAGVAYFKAGRVRVERACLAQELVFARSLNESEARAALISRLERAWAEAESIWSDDADQRRAHHAADVLGIPRWIVGGAWRYRKWRERIRHAA